MIWVTRAGAKVHRVACPWLIGRFIDQGAQFLFVPPGLRSIAEGFALTTPDDHVKLEREFPLYDVCTRLTVRASRKMKAPRSLGPESVKTNRDRPVA